MSIRLQLAVAATLLLATTVAADIRKGTCEFVENNHVEKKADCIIDFYNSGLISLRTSKAEMLFKLYDSRLKQYTLEVISKGGDAVIDQPDAVFVHTPGLRHGHGSFHLLGNPSTKFIYLRDQ